MLKQWKTWVRVLAALALALVLLHNARGPSLDKEARLTIISSDLTFNFSAWEIKALVRKVTFGLLAPQRFMDEDTRARLVLDYLDKINEAKHLSQQINQAYTDPNVENPMAASLVQRETLHTLRSHMRLQSLVAEAILGEHVSQILTTEGGFGRLGQSLPPVSGTFTPLPYILTVSPRAYIDNLYQQTLVPGLTATEQDHLETQIERNLPDLSAYTTAIGGLAAYPAMLLENSAIDWVADTMAHEWVHHYLIFHPVGWEYFNNSEARTINETTASLVGEWAGQEIILHFYAEHLHRPKALPDPLEREKPAEDQTNGGPPPRFDFRAEMRETRVKVDELLAQGNITEAEHYMEMRRQYFVAHGYNIRRLNQAYFAFHGAYASQPGAAGSDPIGPAVRQLWALSKSPKTFVRSITSVTTLAALKDVLR
jgi:hypothetical protein